MYYDLVIVGGRLVDCGGRLWWSTAVVDCGCCYGQLTIVELRSMKLETISHVLSLACPMIIFVVQNRV